MYFRRTAETSFLLLLFRVFIIHHYLQNFNTFRQNFSAFYKLFFERPKNLSKKVGNRIPFFARLLKHEQLSADVVPYEDETGHRNFHDPPFPFRSQKRGGGKQRDFGQELYAEIHAQLGDSQPDDADRRKEQKGGFRAGFFLVFYVSEHKPDG